MFEDFRIAEVERQIAELESMNFGKLDLEKARDLLIPVLRDYEYRRFDVGPDALFRIRANEGASTFNHISELIEPKPEYAKKRQRFNEAGDPRFYCSLTPNTPIFEMRPADGASMTILIMGRRNESVHLNLATLGLHLSPSTLNDGFSHLPLRSNPTFTGPMEKRGIARRWKIQDDYLGRLTTAINADESPEAYLLSSACASFFEAHHECEGLMYPSVASDKNGFNFSIKPEAIHAKYFPAEVWQIRISTKSAWFHEFTERKALNLVVEKVCRQVDPDGSIKWIDHEFPGMPIIFEAAARIPRWRQELSAGRICDPLLL